MKYMCGSCFMPKNRVGTMYLVHVREGVWQYIEIQTVGREIILLSQNI